MRNPLHPSASTEAKKDGWVRLLGRVGELGLDGVIWTALIETGQDCVRKAHPWQALLSGMSDRFEPIFGTALTDWCLVRPFGARREMWLFVPEHILSEDIGHNYGQCQAKIKNLGWQKVGWVVDVTTDPRQLVWMDKKRDLALLPGSVENGPEGVFE